MPYSYDKLRGRIIEKFGSQGEFAKKVGISPTSVSLKMTGKTGFSQAEMVWWGELLDIPVEEYGKYFFG